MKASLKPPAGLIPPGKERVNPAIAGLFGKRQPVIQAVVMRFSGKSKR